jgi:Rrf2 family protein
VFQQLGGIVAVLQVTKRGDYGILAVSHIAQWSRGSFIAIDEIAAQSHIPRPYLSKILQDLCRDGILKSRRGFGGGFMLAVPPERITLRDILHAVEGKYALVSCTGNPALCERSSYCLAAPFWSEIQHFLDDLIASITIADMIEPKKRHAMLKQLQHCRKQYRQQPHNTHQLYEN